MAEPATKTIDEQFHDVAIAIAESRDFTNFCVTRLESRLTDRIGRLEQTMEARLTRQDLILTEILNEVKKH
jgi:hypothetical protein